MLASDRLQYLSYTTNVWRVSHPWDADGTKKTDLRKGASMRNQACVFTTCQQQKDAFGGLRKRRSVTYPKREVTPADKPDAGCEATKFRARERPVYPWGLDLRGSKRNVKLEVLEADVQWKLEKVADPTSLE